MEKERRKEEKNMDWHFTGPWQDQWVAQPEGFCPHGVLLYEQVLLHSSYGLSYGSFSYTYVKRHHKPFNQQTASHRPSLWPLHSLHDRGEELWLEYYQKGENNFFRCRRWSLDLLSLPLSMLKMKPGCALTTGILSQLGLARSSDVIHTCILYI